MNGHAEKVQVKLGSRLTVITLSNSLATVCAFAYLTCLTLACTSSTASTSNCWRTCNTQHRQGGMLGRIELKLADACAHPLGCCRCNPAT